MTDQKLWKRAIELGGLTLAAAVGNFSANPAIPTGLIVFGMVVVFLLLVETGFTEVVARVQ